MNGPHTHTLHVLGTEDKRITICPGSLIVAGYTARNEKAVREHIDELAAIGVSPPPQVPMLYDLDPSLITTGSTVELGAGLTSGELEPLFVRHDGQWYLGLGSDLTNRDMEREGVKESKAACSKPIANTVAALPIDVETGAFDAVWDQTSAESYVDGQPYQRGRLAELRPPSDLLPRIVDEIGLSRINDDIVIFAGTIPLVDGRFRPGARWEARLTFPHGESISHEHQTIRRA